MGRIKRTKDNDGYVYPVTFEKAVYDSDGKRLDNKMSTVVYHSEVEDFEDAELRDADTLGGRIKAKDIDKLQEDVSKIIDDTKTTTSNTWSADKINRDLTDIAKYYDGITSTLGSFPDDEHKGYNRIGTLVVVNCSFKPNSNIAIDSIAITGFPKSIGRMPVFILDYDNTAITGFGAIDYRGRFRNYITLTANHTYMLSGIYEDLEAR